jgi:UDP-perosamine 4-acetyltransferase
VVDQAPVLVVGAGGHALVGIEVLREAGYAVRGCVASHVGAGHGLERLGVPVLGSDDDLAALLADSSAVFVAVGANEARGRLIEAATSAGGTVVTAVSPAAVVSPSASIGSGTLVMPGAVVNAVATVGQGVIVNTAAVVEHECVVGDLAHIAPGAVLAGTAQIGEGALVGVGARVLPGRRVGAWATVGAGAVVVDDVPDGATVVGVPARVVSPSAPVRPQQHSAPATVSRPRVLVLCTGNLCRSPVAEALLRRDLAKAGIEADVSSAGIAAPSGATPDKKVLRVAAEHGVDVTGHRSRRLEPDDVTSADLVLVMTRAQADQVLEMAPEAANRVVTLRAAAWKARALAGRATMFATWASSLSADVPQAERASSASYDIADPIGRPLRRYREMADEVQASVTALVRHWPAS